jgi:hypothetical protein
MGDIDVDARIADLGDGRELELGIGLDVLDVGGERTLDQVEPAGFEACEPHRGIDDRQIDDAVDVDVVLVPVVRELLDHDAILLDALDETIGTGADGMQREPVARRLGGLGRHHHAGAIGELRDQWRVRCLEDELDRQRVDDVDMIDRRNLRAAG